jgi:hypothetical protein
VCAVVLKRGFRPRAWHMTTFVYMNLSCGLAIVPIAGRSEWQGCQTGRKLASAGLACKELNSNCPEGQAAAVAAGEWSRRLAGDLQPISKFHTKYYVWQLMRRDHQDARRHRGNVEHGLETSCTDAAQPKGRMAPLMQMRERPGAKSIAARSIICRIECASPFLRVVLARPEPREASVFRSVGGLVLWNMTTMIGFDCLAIAGRGVSNQLGTFRAPCCSPTKRR